MLYFGSRKDFSRIRIFHGSGAALLAACTCRSTRWRSPQSSCKLFPRSCKLEGQGGQSRKFAESLGKHTDVFKNSGFEGWQFKMLTAARAISQKAHDVMEYPKSNLDTEVPDDAFTFDPEKKDLNQQLFYVLAEKTEGEVFDLVRGVPLQNGAEAWRRLLDRFDARTIGKEMLLARRVVNPPKIKISTCREVAGVPEEVGAGVWVQGRTWTPEGHSL